MRWCWIGLLILLGPAELLAAGIDEPIGAQPDPGLQDATKKGNPKPTYRAPRVDPFDEPIAPLPPVELFFKKEKEERDAGHTIDKDTVLEKLEYDITVDRIPAGKATIKLYRQENYGKVNPVSVYAVSLNTRTNRALGLRYDVDDSARSVFDAKGSFSRFFYMDRKEGSAKVAERITFDYQTAVMAATYERPRVGADEKLKWATSTIPLTGKVLDPLGAVYYLRSFASSAPNIDPNSALNLKNIQPSKTKAALTLPVCSDRHVWNTNLYCIGRENIDLGSLKDRECLIFEVDAPFRGLFERKGKMRVWIDIETGVTIKMTAEIAIGLAEALLNIKKDHSENTPLQ